MTNPCFATSFAAESAFYAAFEAADVDAMMLVWENSELITCIHPLGAPLQGMIQLRASWQQIFATGTRLRFRIININTVTQNDLAIHVVYETITVVNAAEQPRQPIIATNIYSRKPEGWHMVSHHASPAPPIEDHSHRLH
ncbi:MAG: nuclear transport factor 2 family protein [Candidatus Competibacteraceae bacterium]|jgi:ketosteroid isomerase-like protein|nr:nuclear transport factor 2 family protein [Candidatus Competibacteraceae bacterium]